MTTTIDCLIVPTATAPILLPAACVAESIEVPEISFNDNLQADWMLGYLDWNGSDVPLINFDALVARDFTAPETAPSAVVLNPIPKSPRRSFGALICYGKVEPTQVDVDIVTTELPEEIDRRYCESAVILQDQIYVIPKLAAVGVALSYF